MNVDTYKQQAAARAIEEVRSGMVLGLGTGSTAAKFVALLGERVKAGLDVVCVATSEATQVQAEQLGIPMATLDEEPFLDLTVDGADELDAQLRLIKGGGGALTREKIVAAASGRMVVIADHTKHVDELGRFPLPIEVLRFGLVSTFLLIETALGEIGLEGKLQVRKNKAGGTFITDSGNVILDCALGRIPDPETLGDLLKSLPGVVEHGLFLGIADQAFIAGPDGISVIEGERT
jgi:ribose 5-phosphate isomerase A